MKKAATKERFIIMILLLIIIAMFGIGFFIYIANQIQAQSFERGQSVTLQQVIGEVEQNQRVQITDGTQTISLVEEEQITQGQDRIIATLITIAQEDGYLEMEQSGERVFLEVVDR